MLHSEVIVHFLTILCSLNATYFVLCVHSHSINMRICITSAHGHELIGCVCTHVYNYMPRLSAHVKVMLQISF